jgi:hypothetical protein
MRRFKPIVEQVAQPFNLNSEGWGQGEAEHVPPSTRPIYQSMAIGSGVFGYTELHICISMYNKDLVEWCRQGTTMTYRGQPGGVSKRGGANPLWTKRAST